MSENTKINFKSGDLEKLYVAINPNTEITEQGIVWFNSSSVERDNAYPNKLQDMLQNASAVHSNFINLKSNLVLGSGLQPLDPNDVALKAFIDKKNRAGDDLNAIYKKMSMDMALYEASALQIIYDAEGRIAELYHCNPANLRASAPNPMGYSEYWYYSTSWGIVTNKRNRKPSNMISNAVKIANYNPTTGKDDKRQVLYLKKYSPSSDSTYAIPSYNSILNYVQLDFELSQFFLSKVQNSFSSSAIISLKGNPTDEEKNDFVKNFKQKHTGSDSAGKVLFMWSDGEKETPEITRLDAEMTDNLYSDLVAIVTERIAIGHNGNLELAGSDSKGQSLGGDSNKLAVSRNYYILNFIEPLQEVILKGINDLLQLNGLGQVTVSNKPLLEGTTNVASTNQTGANNNTSGATPTFNADLAGLSGKQFINMNRIVRNIKNGKMNKEAGVLMLKGSFGLDDDTINALIADELEDDKLITEQPNLN
jgi:hypothetical protein